MGGLSGEMGAKGRCRALHMERETRGAVAETGARSPWGVGGEPPGTGRRSEDTLR